VVSSRKVVSFGETLWLGMMMSSRIRCNIVGRGEWGFIRQYRGCLSHEGKGMGPEEQLVFVNWTR
jgi:hypothetical protein